MFRHAGFPETYLVPSLTTSGTLGASNASITIPLQGRTCVSWSFKDHTAMTGQVRLLMAGASGSTEYRYFWDGNCFTSTSSLPVGAGATAEKGNTFSYMALPGDQSIQLYVSSYVSGSVDVTITADYRSDPLPISAAFGINGGNPPGFPSEPPVSMSVGGWDPSNASTHRTIAVDGGGRQFMRPWGVAPWMASVAQGSNTRATANKAAGGAGVRHICTGLQATMVSLATPVAPALASLQLRDGATGAGTLLGTWYMACPMTASGNAVPIQLTGLNIRGSANTTMTLEFDTSAGTNVFQAVVLQGISVTE